MSYLPSGYRSHAQQQHILATDGERAKPEPLTLTATEARAVYADDERMLDFIDQGHVAVVKPGTERYGRAVVLRNVIAQAAATAYKRAQAEAFERGRRQAQEQLASLGPEVKDLVDVVERMATIDAGMAGDGHFIDLLIQLVHDAHSALSKWRST